MTKYYLMVRNVSVYKVLKSRIRRTNIICDDLIYRSLEKKRHAHRKIDRQTDFRIPKPKLRQFALDETHSSAVLSLLVFNLRSSWTWCECRERPVDIGKDSTPEGGVLSQTKRLFLFLGKPRTEGSALARFIVKSKRLLCYGTEWYASTGVRYHGGSVFGNPRLPISLYRRMSPLAYKKSPRLTAPVPSDNGSRKPTCPYVRKGTLLSRSMLS